MLNILQIPAYTDNYIYLIHDETSGQTAAVDPGLAMPVLQALQKNQWQLHYILNTHHHPDHVGGNLQLKRQTGCKIIGSKREQAFTPGMDIGLREGDNFQFGDYSIRVIETCGHTLGHIVFYIADGGYLFCGDTLFAMGCGRLFEGTAKQFWQAFQKLKALPPETNVYCAHEYTLVNGTFALIVEPDNLALQQRMQHVKQLRANLQSTMPTTIAEELATNPFFREDSPAIQARFASAKNAVERFAALRKLKDCF